MYFISENSTRRLTMVCLCQVNVSALVKLMNCLLVYIIYYHYLKKPNLLRISIEK